MIPITKEDKDLYKHTNVYENCVFCDTPTDTWHEATNQPVCSTCAKTHLVSELKKSHPDYEPPQQPAKSTRRIRHISISIEGLLRNAGKKSLRGFITEDDGTLLSDQEVRIYLTECQRKGWKVLPLNDKCDNFDYITGCPGHDIPETNK